MRPLKKAWTEDDDRRLLDLREAGRSFVSIGVALKRSAKAVNLRLDLLRGRQRQSAVPNPFGKDRLEPR